jgi:hypothetical protein
MRTRNHTEHAIARGSAQVGKTAAQAMKHMTDELHSWCGSEHIGNLQQPAQNFALASPRHLDEHMAPNNMSTCNCQ